jgi:hypothetical protein
MYGNGIGGDETHPDTIVVLRDTRVFPSGEAPPDFHTFDPVASGISWDQYGRYWYSERTEVTPPPDSDMGFPNFKACWDTLPPADYYTICNEQGGGEGNTPAEKDEIRRNVQRLCDIERAIAYAANADGRKCCVGNFAGGSPGDFELWKEIIAPFILEAWQNGGNIYGRHVYADQFIDANGNVTPGQPQRVINELKHLQFIGYGGGVVLTECGLDGGYGVADLSRFTYQVQAWEAALRPYADILMGFCFWECGDTGFHADYTNHLKTLIPFMNNSYLGKWEPAETQQPPTGGGGEPMQVTIGNNHGGYITHLGTGAKTITLRPGRFEGNTFVQDGDILEIPLGENVRALQYVSNGQRVIEVDCPEKPNPPQPKPYLEIEALGQRDTRWAHVTLGQPTGHGATIGGFGCLLVAYNCLARYWGLTTRLPAAENAHYVSAGAFSAQFIKPAALRTAYPDSVAYDGYLTRDSVAMRDKVRDWIDNGWPVPCRVDFNPATGQWEQHWVLVVGYIGDTDFYMMDPWHGDIAVVNDRYAIAGSDILEAIFYRPEETTTTPPTPPPGQTVNMTQYYLPPSGRTYGDISIKSTNWGQGDIRQQLQLHGGYCYVTKGGEIEKRMIIDGRIYFLLDDSPGDGKYYTVNSPTGWIPAQWAVGQTFTRQETATFYYKSNCQPTGEVSNWTNQMLFKVLYAEWTSPHGIKLQNVAHLQWLVNGVVEEEYFLAPGLGYAGWKNRHGRESWIKELIPHTDQQPNKFAGGCYHTPVG